MQHGLALAATWIRLILFSNIICQYSLVRQVWTRGKKFKIAAEQIITKSSVVDFMALLKKSIAARQANATRSNKSARHKKSG